MSKQMLQEHGLIFTALVYGVHGIFVFLVGLILWLIPSDVQAGFLSSCLAGDKDIQIAVERILKDDNVEDRCLRAFEKLSSTDELNLSCGDYELKCDKHEILHNVDWISEFTKLTYLNLNHHQLTDISALGKLVNLEFLELNANPLTDLKPLLNLPELRELSLAYIKSLTNDDYKAYFDTHPDLYVLYLNDTKLSDIQFVKNMDSLTIFDISYTNVRDLNQLNLNRGWIALFIDGLDADNLMGLQLFPRLRIFSANDNNLTSLSGIEKQTGLQILSVEGNQLNQAYEIMAMPFLQWFYAGFNHLKDLSMLQVKDSMVVLSLNNNEISNLAPISFLSYLKKVEVFENPVNQSTCYKQLSMYDKKELVCQQLNAISRPHKMNHIKLRNLFAPVRKHSQD